ncbi:hypothetical protein EJ05DRAFT_507039 [Pseudovirgaria hyperparasitica]|uniref:C3H1-type domain-containing protein n=1 Tax=Pseudovirgaria hyperparasitica TaxID=470096 RepID=A0A6A6WMW6_9PEZI|nr:uncharacterized protein EJ05DRAFT_507039 [Pseudovirgaria hyperparasitica]KAF2763446.1 hypothetical protein EJ05DRAFT_507039 [Pseudovirgaria hyperparasitica]
MTRHAPKISSSSSNHGRYQDHSFHQRATTPSTNQISRQDSFLSNRDRDHAQRKPKDFSHPVSCFYWDHGGCGKSDEECWYAHYHTGNPGKCPIKQADGTVVAGKNADASLSLDQRERAVAQREQDVQTGRKKIIDQGREIQQEKRRMELELRHRKNEIQQILAQSMHELKSTRSELGKFPRTIETQICTEKMDQLHQKLFCIYTNYVER